jgi:hypothetical protein
MACTAMRTSPAPGAGVFGLLDLQDVGTAECVEANPLAHVKSPS